MNVTIVDEMSGWESVFLATMDKLQNNFIGNAGKLSRDVSISSTFLRSDITNSSLWHENEMENTLKETDLVFLVKILSTISCGYNRRNALKNIASHMKTGAVLIYIDNSSPADFTMVSSYLKCIYDSLRRRYYLQSRNKFNHNNVTRCHAEVKLFVKI
ncbi:uncharacterized protein CDAR_231701 [Caerostris darwini]|uniref:Uncharacterized protein n=1 Tax=Caerostris darwini TaxID=1538125 RepID=A0AAV4X5H0_9ARAC|nr:hypothetical protein CDAR_231571 [Caerostris darwini]GIY90105.1 uncharacterized protein CDAR_231701 [Caerostris darwini]